MAQGQLQPLQQTRYAHQAATTVAASGEQRFEPGSNFGLSADSAGVVWGVEELDRQIFTLGFLESNVVATYSSDLAFDNLAFDKDSAPVVPEPLPGALGLMGLVRRRRRR